jgi:glycosyltransferase involved in cell wall biosynthesis
MSETLSLSIVTPSYNQVAFIERTIRSVLDQRVEGLEYMVVDGGSNDGTVEILERYADRLCYRSEPDQGQADAVNRGIALTSGDLIGWLNSDDIYYPTAVRTVRDYFAAHPDVDVVYGNADHIDQQDRVLHPYDCEPWDPQRLREVCFLCQPAVFFRRRIVERYGMLDQTLHYCMDYEYWLRLADHGARFAYLPSRLAGSRMYAWNKTMGQRLAVHAEINRMLRHRLGSVPARWLSNYAHVVLEQRGVDREDRRRFAVSVALLTWYAALRWNRRVSSQVRHTTWVWVRDALRAGRARSAAPKERIARAGHHPPLRVGFDVSQTGTRRAGCGHMALGLVQALLGLPAAHRYLLYPTFGDTYWDPSGPEATWHGEHPNVRRWQAHASLAEAREFWRAPPPDLDAALGNPDIVHSHNFFCPRGLERARLVYTLHDLSFLAHPEWTTEANRQACFSGVFNASLHADMIVAMSEATRRHFLKMFPHYPEHRTCVVHSASRFANGQPIPRPRECDRFEPARFFLGVGTLEPRKNFSRLVSAYAGYVSRVQEPMPLVLVGGRGWLMDAFEQQVRELDLGRRLIRMGYVEDRTLQWLYQNCHSFLCPSLFEGFGLPVIEALSQGAAVMTSRATSMPEVAGEAALYVDAEDTSDIEQGLMRIAGDDSLRSLLKSRAALQAAGFSWRTAAAQTVDCYERVMQSERYVAAAAAGAVISV